MNGYTKRQVAEGRRLVEQLQQDKWRLGDLALEVAPMGDGHARNGASDVLDDYADAIGLEAGTLRQYRTVANAWPDGTRVPSASWSVHRELLNGRTTKEAHRLLKQLAKKHDRVTVNVAREATDRAPANYSKGSRAVCGIRGHHHPADELCPTKPVGGSWAGGHRPDPPTKVTPDAPLPAPGQSEAAAARQDEAHKAGGQSMALDDAYQAARRLEAVESQLRDVLALLRRHGDFNDHAWRVVEDAYREANVAWGYVSSLVSTRQSVGDAAEEFLRGLS